MGTRSLTAVFDGKDKRPFYVIYKQYDGYPTGLGADLATYLSGVTLINGMSSDKHAMPAFANGPGCLAAQLLVHLKTGIGNVYLLDPRNWKDLPGESGDEYRYEVRIFGADLKSVKGVMKEVPGRVTLKLTSQYEKENGGVLFDDDVKAYASWLARVKAAEEAAEKKKNKAA